MPSEDVKLSVQMVPQEHFIRIGSTVPNQNTCLGVAGESYIKKLHQDCCQDSLSTHSSSGLHPVPTVCLPVPLLVEVTKRVAVNGVKSPQEGYQYFASCAHQKQLQSIWKTLWLGIMSGMYIGLGYALASAIAGQLPEDFMHSYPGFFNLVYGSFGLPVGLMMVILTGAELFTSTCAYMAAGVLEGRASVYALLRSLLLSYLSNLAGCLLLVGLLLGADIFKGKESFILYLGYKKTHYTWGATLLRGVLCNWLVCMAVYQAALAQDLCGKFLGLWLPVSSFMALGFEHCIANQFILPMGLVLHGSGCAAGSEAEAAGWCSVTLGRVVGHNLVPATIGNIIGGMLFLGVALAFPYGRPGKMVDRACDQLKPFPQLQQWAEEHHVYSWPAHDVEAADDAH